MKTLKGFIVCLLLGISYGGFAQEQGGRGNFQNVSAEERAKTTVERLTKELSLEKPQQDSIYVLTLEQANIDKAAFESANGDREKVRSIMQTNRATYNNKIKKFLTAEQLEKYNKLEEERSSRGPR